ncbi:hypothetical protein RND81_09G147700 [Saponaria officinalis]|uniref:KIB1-4 beta-propeller domain-containing protein n=1 Tax=Saponaria officinalis TaxID=3572 RepID=A0AAW1IKW6_SAPOF
MAYWSDLLPELLDIVTTRFDNSSDDLRHFRSVCSTWRSAVPKSLSTQFPPIKFFDSNNNVNHYDIRLVKHSFYHLSLSSNPDLPGWLIKIEEKNRGTVKLFHPFSRSPIKHLPSNFPKQLDLTNIRIRELDYEYVLRNVNYGNVELFNMEHEKVALITSPNSNNSNEFVILSTHGTGKLLMYRSTVKVWSFLDDLTLRYDDRSVYVNDWCMHYVDVKEFKDTTPQGMVKVHAIEIFKLDRVDQKWILVKNLKDRAIFLSNHSTFSAIGLRGCKGNCIYFRFNNFDDKNKCCLDITTQEEQEKMDDFEWKCEEIGVFDFEKGVVGRLEEYLDNSRLFSWPPPTWVISAK